MLFRKRSSGSCLPTHFIVAAAFCLAAATGQPSADAAKGGLNIPPSVFDLPRTPGGDPQTAVLAGGFSQTVRPCSSI